MWVFWILHILFHAEKESYNGLIFYTLVFLGALTVITSGITFVHYYATQDEPIKNPYFMFKNSEFEEYDVVFWMILASYLLPVLASFFVSMYGASFKLMVQSMFHFYLFLPTMTAWMTSYSFCRTHDLSWGNRPSSDDFETLTDRKAAAKRAEIKAHATGLTLLMVGGNFVLFMCPQQILLLFTMFLFIIILMEMVLSLVYNLLSHGICYRSEKYGRCFRRLWRGPSTDSSARASLLESDYHLLTDNQSSVQNEDIENMWAGENVGSRHFFPDSTISIGND